MISLIIMPKSRTFWHISASSEDKFVLVKMEDEVPDLSGQLPWGPSLVGAPSGGPPGFGQVGGHNRGLWPPPAAKGVWGRNPQPLANFYIFHIKKTHFSTLFIERGHAVSVVTMENAKIFSLLADGTSKSRSLAKISERRRRYLLMRSACCKQ